MERFENDTLDMLRAALNRREEEMLSPVATISSRAVRRHPEDERSGAYRQDYSLDVDRILHSLAYTRYIDKTQVFYLIKNDHITHRVLHVQLVSKIARTIGRFLGLNEDLIEAIALGHDIGHTPFGHDGERFLSRLCEKHDIGGFQHNLQSVQFLERVERKGRGWNLCLQTLDGILCHDGEVHDQRLQPKWNKDFDRLDRDLAAKRQNARLALMPMSLEGCVVRMADTISYIGRDIEDAIRLGLVARSELPDKAVRALGSTNGTIVYNLVTDVIRHSYRQPFLTFSTDVSEALKTLKAFNLERIYMNPDIKRHTLKIEQLFVLLFNRYMKDLHLTNRDSVIFRNYLKDMDQRYLDEHRPAEIVRDFIAGMTDRYFLQQCPASLRPAVENR
ncbi:MAG: HD domain-containing protein [Desulfobacterales bacterium]|nr:HD domain-containing protein [Desulfobacterales bacterium]MDJ0988649.1 HD domain-containing protein [Desulfobacterales bacterium]